MRRHPRDRQPRRGRVAAVIIATAPVRIGHHRLAPDLVEGDVLRGVPRGRRDHDGGADARGIGGGPAERLHAAHRPAHDRAQPPDAEVIQQHRLRPHHVADRDHREAHGIGPPVRTRARRARRSHAASQHVGAHHEVPQRIDRPPRPDHPRPPAGLARPRMDARHMLVARQRVADEDCVRPLGVQLAIGLVRDLDGRQVPAPIERERPGEHDAAIEAETLVRWHETRRTGKKRCPTSVAPCLTGAVMEPGPPGSRDPRECRATAEPDGAVGVIFGDLSTARARFARPGNLLSPAP